MQGHIRTAELAARIEMNLTELEDLAASLCIRIIEVRGQRFVRLRAAAKIVRAVDGPTDPTWSCLPELLDVR